MNIDSEKFYVASEVADILRCSLANVYSLLNREEIRRTSVGAGKSGIRVQGSDLLAFIESRKSGGPKLTAAFKYLKLRQGS